MKPENKETLKSLFGELAIQAALGLILAALGGIGLAYIFIGWGVIWLLLPFAALIYWLIKKQFSNIAVERDASPQSGSRPSP